MADRWIQGANIHPGRFTAKAQAVGESVPEYASEEANAPGRLGREARLAQTFEGMASNKRHVAHEFAHKLSAKIKKGMD